MIEGLNQKDSFWLFLLIFDHKSVVQNDHFWFFLFFFN